MFCINTLRQKKARSINIFFLPTYLFLFFYESESLMVMVSMLVLPLSVYICFHAIISIIIITCYCYCSSTSSVEYDAINLIIYLLTAFGKIAPLFCFFADELRNRMKCCRLQHICLVCAHHFVCHFPKWKLTLAAQTKHSTKSTSKFSLFCAW